MKTPILLIRSRQKCDIGFQHNFLRKVSFMEVMLLLFLLTFNVQAQDKVFKAGAATSNITPPLGVEIVGNWGTPLASHVHDELHVRCLALDDGEKRLVFAVVDNLGINREVFDEAKRLVHEATGLPKDHMMMSATHTHSGPTAGGKGERTKEWAYDKPLIEYQLFLARRISDGVQRAINNLEPARIAWGAGNVPQHVFNRRWKMKPGTPTPNPFGGQDQAVMNPGVANENLLEPAGPTDPQVSFLTVQSKEGRPIALLGNYSLHYVGGVPREHISADYFAVFSDRIQELIAADREAPPFVGILSNGTEGDINNINFRGPAEKNPPYAKMRLVADDVAQEVYRIYQTLEFKDWVSLDARQRELTLTVRKPDAALLERAKKLLATKEDEPLAHPLEKVYAERLFQIQQWPDEIEVILQSFSVGDLGIASIPFEAFAEIGLQIKDKSPLPSTFVVGLANGNYGYLPTPAQHQLGGYETWYTTNRVETKASEKIVSTLLEMFSELK